MICRDPVEGGCTFRTIQNFLRDSVEELERYRARGYVMAGNRIAIVTDQPEDLVEVHPPLRWKVDLGWLMLERRRHGLRDKDRATLDRIAGMVMAHGSEGFYAFDDHLEALVSALVDLAREAD